ncbi:MAG: hypothetical protein EOM20_17760 [Spartobacteria bacterium]|nr:hypothetical protein [Spartobacteria bacterium]
MKTIVYYTSAHGYGHGVRTCDIINAITRCYPEARIILTSGLPESFLRNRIPSEQLTCRMREFDVGMVQLDSVMVDVGATLREVEGLYTDQAELVATETAFLEQVQASAVVVDIPAIPIEAARKAGVPVVAVGNFSWDWIYSAFVDQDARWQALIDRFKAAYAQADLLLRLPFAGDMSVFPVVEDLPLLASPGSERRSLIQYLTGCDPQKKWVLVSFSTLNWNAAALTQLARLSDYEFFTVKPLEFTGPNIYSMDRSQVSFSDVLASVDVVLSKPGYGVLSECIVNEKPLVFVDRTDFLEYPVLEAAVKRYLKHRHISQDDLYAGNLLLSLAAVAEAAAPPERLARGGDEIAAHRIMAYAGA